MHNLTVSERVFVCRHDKDRVSSPIIPALVLTGIWTKKIRHILTIDIISWHQKERLSLVQNIVLDALFTQGHNSNM